MSSDIPGGWIALAVGVIGSGGLSGLFMSRGTKEGALIDQYQERYAEQEQRADKQDKKIEAQGDKIDTLLRREITMRNYVLELRTHIAEGKPPPPPEMPAELLP